MTFREFIELDESRFGDFLQGGIKGAALGSALLGSSFVNKPSISQTPVSTTQTIATTQPTTLPTTQSIRRSIDLDYVASYISKNEGGPRLQVYNDGIGKPTIGVGHYIQDSSRAIFENLFGNKVNFDAVLRGQQKLTPDQVNILFKHDLQEHVDRAQRLVPNLNTYPPYLQAALIDAVYRGDLGPQTVRLINAGHFDLAAKEYLNHKQYKNREALGIPGIGPRMERNRDALIRYQNEISRDTMR